MISFYETLEVSPRASDVVIRAAYRCLVQRYHPDKNPDSADAGLHLTRINQAYAVLSDPQQRLNYDREQALTGGFDERRGYGAAPPKGRGQDPAVAPTTRPFGFRELTPLNQRKSR